MKKTFSLIFILTICININAQIIRVVDSIAKLNRNNICEVSFETPPVNYVQVDCELVMNDNFDAVRAFDEIKKIQNQLLEKGYDIDTTGVLDLKTVKAYSDYKRSKTIRRAHITGNVYFSKKMPYLANKDTSSYERFSVHSWKNIKKFRGKCSAVYIDDKNDKTFRIPCNILDDKPFFIPEKIKGLQYQLIGLGYDLDTTGIPDRKTFEAYAENEKNKKRALKEEKKRNKKNKK